MLVLSRNKNESIKINDDITLVVIDIRGDKVRLGIEAPRDVTIHRTEVYEKIKQQKQSIQQLADPQSIHGENPDEKPQTPSSNPNGPHFHAPDIFDQQG